MSTKRAYAHYFFYCPLAESSSRGRAVRAGAPAEPARVPPRIPAPAPPPRRLRQRGLPACGLPPPLRRFVPPPVVLPQIPNPPPLLGPWPIGPVPSIPGMTHLLGLLPLSIAAIAPFPEFAAVETAVKFTFIQNNGSGRPAGASTAASTSSPSPASSRRGRVRCAVFGDPVVAALDVKGPPAAQRPGHHAAGLGQNSREGGPGYPHPLGCSRLLHPFGIGQAKRLQSLHRQGQPLQPFQRHPLRFVKGVDRDPTHTPAFAWSRHRNLPFSYEPMIIIMSRPRGVKLYFEHLFIIKLLAPKDGRPGCGAFLR
jgi:hypothetical protein